MATSFRGGKLARLFSGRIFKKVIKTIATIFIVISLTFLIIHLMPGNPIQIYIEFLMTNMYMDYDSAKALAASLFAIDLDAPIHIQYVEWLRGLMRGDLGVSIWATGTPVSKMIAAFLPWTLFSVSISLFTSFSVGILLGMLIAYKRGSVLDNVLTAFASVTSAIPNYLIGYLLILFLAVQWDLVPIFAMRGAMSPGITPGFNLPFIADIFFHVAMPYLTYVITTVGSWMLIMKSSTISTLGEDYVTAARARGLPDRRITFSYVGRNAILPLFTSLAISLGFIFGGSTLIETIFVYRGIGFLLWQSVANRDYTVMQGIFLIITIAVITSNLLADLLYSRIDPRIR